MGGALQSLGGAIYWPSPIVRNNSETSNALIDAEGESFAFIFFPPKTGAIRKFTIRTGSTTASAGDLEFRAETVGADGFPTGTLWNAGASATVNVTSGNTYYTATLGTDATVSNLDAPMALVIRIPAGSTLQTEITRESNFGHFPYAASNVGSGYTLVNAQGPFVVEYSDGTIVPIINALPGHPATQNINTGTTPDEVGNIFRFSVPCRIRGVWATIFAGTAADFDLVLYEGTTVRLTRTVSDQLANASGVRSLFPVIFPATFEAAPNTDYRIVVKPTTGTNVPLTRVIVPSAAAMGMMDGGTTIRRTERTDGGAFSEVDTERVMVGVLIDALELGGGGGGGGGTKFVTLGGQW